MLKYYLCYVTDLYRLSFIVGLGSLFIAKKYLPDFLEYGKTLKDHPEGKGDTIFNYIMHFTVPKSYFGHFYILSTILSIITVSRYHQYPITWMYLFHSIRRLYETLYISKYSNKSRMNWSHYAVGIWFYSVVHIILNIKLNSGEINNKLNTNAFYLFIISSVEQFRSHLILSKLVKYSLPTDGLFKYVCCPHYLCEVGIYASLVLYNVEFLFPLVWVIASLSVSAIETRYYYKTKFKDQIVPNYAIIPFLI